MDKTMEAKPYFHYQTKEGRLIEETLAKTFEKLLGQVGDTPTNRLKIAEYTLGYMGATYGLHVS